MLPAHATLLWRDSLIIIRTTASKSRRQLRQRMKHSSPRMTHSAKNALPRRSSKGHELRSASALQRSSGRWQTLEKR